MQDVRQSLSSRRHKLGFWEHRHLYYFNEADVCILTVCQRYTQILNPFTPNLEHIPSPVQAEP